jgi:hypothetical protein
MEGMFRKVLGTVEGSDTATEETMNFITLSVFK